MRAGRWLFTHGGEGGTKSNTVAAALLLLVSANAGAAATYSIIDLGTLGGPRSMAYGLNDVGQVVGWAEPVGGPPYHAFLWGAGAMSDLGTLGGVQSAAMDINNAGQITGWSFLQGDTSISAFSTSTGGPLVGLGTLPGFWSSLGYRINEAGQIAGQAIRADGVSRAISIVDGQVAEIGSVGPHQSSIGYGINDAGVIAGWTDRAFVVANGTMTYLPGLTPDGPTGAQDINNAGAVVGWARGTDLLPHVTVWQDGAISDLGTFLGAPSFGEAINEAGQIVGRAWVVDANYEGRRAFLIDSGAFVDLSSLPSVIASGWDSLNEAFDINESGQIVGWGMRDGAWRAFLMTPVAVPAPPTLFIFAIGLACVCLVRRSPTQ